MYLCAATLVAVLTFGLCPEVSAQEDGDSGYKIGVVDMQAVLAKYEKRKQKYEELEQEVEQRQAGIDEMSEKIEAMKERYESEKDTMDPDELLALEKQIRDDYATYRSELDKQQRYIDNQEEMVLKEILKDVEAAINKLATEENYHLILNAKSGPRGSVLYHSPTIDITSKVLSALNSE